MADADFITHENDRIAGGLACMEALRRLETVAVGDDGARTAEDYLRIRDSLISDFVAHAGDLSSRAAGFMETLVEFAFTSMETNIPDLNNWKSIASMNEAELAADRKRFADSWAGEPGPTMENTEDATNRLVCSLSCDISFINNILNMVEERVGKGRDGALFSLLEAVMPRMRQALERVEKLEVMV